MTSPDNLLVIRTINHTVNLPVYQYSAVSFHQLLPELTTI